MKTQFSLIAAFLYFLPILSHGQVNYSSSIQPILNSRCVSCHGPGHGIDLRNYEAVMNSVSSRYSADLVIPEDAVASPLYDKIRLDQSPKFGSRMPQGSTLPQEQVDLIRDWINEGALENAATSTEIIASAMQYKLLPNYPNPFNPSTNIRFISAQSNRFEISVYNTLGQEIFERAGVSNKGLNIVRVDLMGQSSGLYFYNIRVFESGALIFNSSAQLTLIK